MRCTHFNCSLGCTWEDAALERLVAYEDSGMTPERVLELSQAEADGRLVVLPCKVGDTIYKLCPVSLHLKIGDLWSGKKIQSDCDRCAWGSCDCHDIGPRFDGKSENVIHEMVVGSLTSLSRIIPYFGSIYFLTREEAEAELQRLEDKSGYAENT